MSELPIDTSSTLIGNTYEVACIWLAIEAVSAGLQQSKQSFPALMEFGTSQFIIRDPNAQTSDAAIMATNQSSKFIYLCINVKGKLGTLAYGL